MTDDTDGVLAEVGPRLRRIRKERGVTLAGSRTHRLWWFKQFQHTFVVVRRPGDDVRGTVAVGFSHDQRRHGSRP